MCSSSAFDRRLNPSPPCSLGECTVSASPPASSGCARTTASCCSRGASATVRIIARCNSSALANGPNLSFLRQAPSATHGECSNTAPQHASQAGRSSRLRCSKSMAYIIGRMLSAERILERCESLAQHSELPGGLTRVFLSPQARAASDKVLGWMREAGMQAKLDAIGNAAGRYEGERPGLPCLMLGSHLDTVRDAGKYDGMLGVIAAIECVSFLNSKKKRLPFAIEVIGFGDEEGVRFGTTLLGSRAVAGIFDQKALSATDATGKTMSQALIDFGLDP